jgi:hypothetical protein
VGDALGHAWVEANCMSPKHCTTCGLTEGETGDHGWLEPTCEEPKRCEFCELTEGEPVGHAWLDATCENPKYCLFCELTEGEALEHIWVEATCESPKYCEFCELTEGEALGHDWVEGAEGEPRTCATCGRIEGSAADSRFDAAACEKLFGTWTGKETVTGEFLGMPGVEGQVEATTIITFNDDGTYSMTMKVDDQAGFEAMIVEYIYAMFAAEGMSKEQVDVMFALSGQSMQQIVKETCDEMLGQEMQGVYYVSNDELYMGESWDAEMSADEIVIDGDQLKVYNAEMDMAITLSKI